MKTQPTQLWELIENLVQLEKGNTSLILSRATEIFDEVIVTCIFPMACASKRQPVN